MEQSDRILLNRIVNHLMINTSFMKNIGLYHGKMGVVLFFIHYSRYIKKNIFDDFAEELFDEVYKEIHDQLPVDFENGLCGIGWAILYLLDHGFFYGDVDDVLEDLDKEILKWNLMYLTDKSFERGIGGINCYVNYRIRMSKKQTCFDGNYISSLKLKMNGSMNSDVFYLPTLINKICIDDFSSSVSAWNLGLSKGCSGLGLKMIMS
jgi:hypothetical protein